MLAILRTIKDYCDYSEPEPSDTQEPQKFNIEKDEFKIKNSTNSYE